MLNTIRMPQMGVSDESAILSKWLVREGDRIRRGQPVFSLETDKATFQYEAESDGILVRILTGEGEEAAVGSPVCILSDTNDLKDPEIEILLNHTGKEKKQNRDQEQGQTRQDPHTAPETPPEPAEKSIPPQIRPDAKRKVSPRARKKADMLGVGISTIRRGSGPEGRILECDVMKEVQRNRFSGETEQGKRRFHFGRPLTQDDRVRVRKIEGGNTTVQTGFTSRLVDARRILALCTPQNGFTTGTAVCYELAQFLTEHPELNARRHGDSIYEYGPTHLRLTVATPSGTLKPVIRCAGTYTLNELDLLMRNATARCRLYASKPQEFQEGTFTVADMSEYGADSFLPELTPPELCALGIGAVAMQTETDESGGIEAYPAIRLTLVYDRICIDALRAAELLHDLALRIEQGAPQ